MLILTDDADDLLSMYENRIALAKRVKIINYPLKDIINI